MGRRISSARSPRAGSSATATGPSGSASRSAATPSRGDRRSARAGSTASSATSAGGRGEAERWPAYTTLGPPARPSLWMPLPLLASSYKGEETEWRPHKSLKSHKIKGGLSTISTPGLQQKSPADDSAERRRNLEFRQGVRVGG